MALTRATRFLSLTAAGVIAVTGLLAVGPAGAVAPATKNVTLTLTILPAQVRLIPGESVKVMLSTNLTTGYTWSAKVAGDNAAVQVSTGKYRAPTGDLIGAPGTTTWIVTAKAKGTAIVKFFTTPPGAGDRQRVGSLTVIVHP